jgi:predicted nucleic acid-binding Zn ribbon protein
MTTLDHTVEEECRRILRRKRRRDKFHVFMSAVKMALLVNLISHYVVDIS